MTWRGSTTVTDRIFASLPYLFPLFAVFLFGMPVFKIFPPLAQFLFVLLTPMRWLYSIIPFAPDLIIFFLLFLLVVRNERILHFIRFNTMQALLLDIIVFLCGLILPLLGATLITQSLMVFVFLASRLRLFNRSVAARTVRRNSYAFGSGLRTSPII
jgi:hypothetical protein